jgi:hypothetical protein
MHPSWLWGEIVDQKSLRKKSAMQERSSILQECITKIMDDEDETAA